MSKKATSECPSRLYDGLIWCQKRRNHKGMCFNAKSLDDGKNVLRLEWEIRKAKALSKD